MWWMATRWPIRPLRSNDPCLLCHVAVSPSCLPLAEFYNLLERKGLRRSDVRIKDLVASLDHKEASAREAAAAAGDEDAAKVGLNLVEFLTITRSNVLVDAALSNKLIVPDFEEFCAEPVPPPTKTHFATVSTALLPSRFPCWRCPWRCPDV